MKNKDKTSFETFDMWGKAQFALWSNIRYDFELIAELTRYRKNSRSCLELLNTVNKYINNPPDNVFFDGTIKCLKYLIKNGYLSLDNLPRLTGDEKYLVNLLDKYAKRLDIVEVMSDIEEPTLRVMLIEYPHLLSEVLKDNPLAGHLVGKAMLKNGIKNEHDLVKKVDNGLNSIEVDLDKNSIEAMKCKIIFLSLFVMNKQISLTSDMAEEFKKLTNDSMEKGIYEKGIFNATYAVFYGHSLWNEDKKGHLSGCDELYLNFQLLMLPKNHMAITYDLFLKKYVDEIGKKYFGDEYRSEGSIMTLAIKMAVLIILFRISDFQPKSEKEEVPIYPAGSMLRGMNYAIKDSNTPELKQWFIDYFCSELEKRVAFIKMQIENNVGVVSMMGRERVVYLPVFESFRFFCERDGLLYQIINLFKNKKIPSSVKDEIFINFALNIQKISYHPNVSEDEKRIKDKFIILLKETFDGLVVKTGMSLRYQAQKYYQDEDLIAEGILGVVELILNFDLSKNSSFIAYIESNLEFKIRTGSRRLKGNDDSGTFSESEFSDSFFDNFLESIPDNDDFLAKLEDGELFKEDIQKVKNYIERLPEKEKEAVKKIASDNEKFTATERKAKNRGLNKIREMIDAS